MVQTCLCGFETKVRPSACTEHTTTECLLFPDIFERPVIRSLIKQGSSDGGAICSRRPTRAGSDFRVAACRARSGNRARSCTNEELLTQRVMGMALGYETPTTPHVWHAIRCTAVVGRSIDGEDRARSPRCRVLKMPRIARNCCAMSEALAGLRHRAPSQTAAWPRPPHHHRSGPDRRPHARPATVHLFQ